jgi:hypothetical protein
MTAKEKAKELVDKMKLKKDVIDDNNYWSANESGAKECALICVDEILNSHIDSIYETYYLKVKEEINKL